MAVLADTTIIHLVHLARNHKCHFSVFIVHVIIMVYILHFVTKRYFIVCMYIYTFGL